MMFWQGAEAQKRDTTIYAVMNNGQQATSVKTADYFLFVLPPDSSSGVKLYPIQEYYPNGKRKLIAASSTKDYSRLRFEGAIVTYYPNGSRNSITNYVDGVMTGTANFYYPNGKLYSVEEYSKNGQHYLIECHDSTGNKLAENGNGKWLRYDWEFKILIEEGPVKDSLENGEWAATYDKTKNYITVYSKGLVISSTDPFKPKGDMVFVTVQHEPEYKNGGKEGLFTF